MRKVIGPAYFIFLVLNILSGFYYFNLGQWKGYVRLFSLAELLLTLLALGGFFLFWKKERGLFLLIAVGLLCTMQIFPVIGAFFIFPWYFKNGFFHLLILAFGIPLWSAFFALCKKRQRAH